MHHLTPGGDIRTALGPTRIAAARDVAVDVLTKIADPDRRSAAYAQTAALAAGWGGNPGDRLYLSTGLAGIALAYHAVGGGDPSDPWTELARRAATTAASLLDAGIGPAALMSGTAGIAAAVALVGEAGARGAALDVLVERVRVERRRVRGLIGRNDLRETDYDLVSGLAGAGAALRAFGTEPAARTELDAVVATLRALVAGGDPGRPLAVTARWSPPEIRDAAPDGFVNLSAAHGVAGVASLLAMHAPAPGERPDANLATLVDLLIDSARGTHNDPGWDGRISIPSGSAVYPQAHRIRPGWCYGPAGIARALWLASTALDRHDLAALALRVIRSAVRSTKLDTMPMGLCHGIAGLLASAYLFAHDTGAADLSRAVVELVDRVLAGHDQAALVGFRDDTPDGPVDDAGWLDGAAGIALTLLSVAADDGAAWTRLLLMR